MKKNKIKTKKLYLKFILIILSFLILSFSCSKSDSIDNSGTNNNSDNNSNDNNNDNNDSTEKTTYYISSSSGNDNNQGTENNPWKTLSKISNIELSPGDSVFFKKGDNFIGHFKINGSGSEDKPLVITSYGSSNNKPILSGSGSTLVGGDFQESIYVNNNDNMIFDGLEIQNNRTNKKNDIDDSDSFGIYVHNTSDNIMNNFTFRNITFKNIYAISQVDPSNQEAFNQFEVAGVRFFTDWAKAHINNVLFENNLFTDLQRFGVHVKHSNANNGLDNRHTDFVFRNNEFKEIGGTCILPSRARNILIEDNIFNKPGAKTNSRMIGRGSAVWNWNSVNTIIQRNKAIGIRGILDSHGIHVDHKNINTFIQYNYMEDCEGGFVEILGGNETAVYRFNISVNDGWRDNPNWKNSNHTIWLNDKIGGDEGYSSNNSYIYNNTIIINRSNNPYQTAIDLKANNTRVFNNIFYSINGSSIGSKQVNVNDDNLYMTNNLFYGSIDNRFINIDTNPIDQNPGFYNENLGNEKGFQLLKESGAINNGTSFSGNFSHPPIPTNESVIFSNVESIPSVDFFGHSLNTNSTPNVGASNAKNGEIIN